MATGYLNNFLKWIFLLNFLLLTQRIFISCWNATTDCHCSDNSKCTRNPFSCDGACDDGRLWGNVGEIEHPWSGDTCVVGNIARDKLVSVLNEEEYADSPITNGFTNAIRNDDCIRITTEDGGNAYFKIDLGAMHRIYSVTIYNYRNNDELEDTYIRVSNDPEDDLSSNGLDGCSNIGSNEEDDMIVKQCDNGLVGQYIGMRRRSSAASNSDILELCEMVVIGYRYGDCPPSKYGVDCSETCSSGCADCDAVDGCVECDPGYEGSDCTRKCSPPTFGADCAESCSNCKGNACDHVDGRCEDGCKRGYRGAYCNQECPAPSYGQDCAESCNNCNNENCQNTDGYCHDGCMPGYEGSYCDDECTAPDYGNDCAQTCDNCRNENCRNTDGYCHDGCMPGYEGSRCDDECTAPNYGDDCAQTCDNCKNGECRHTDGRCDDGCVPGYEGSRCDRVCPDNSYGADCDETCASNCVSCHHIDGCSADCSRGYQGDNCTQECISPSYGPGCRLTCSPHCISCHHIDGCTDGCNSGYQGDGCTEKCSSGTFDDCLQTCPTNCAGCHHVTGVCDDCVDGYEGEACAQAIQDSSSGGGNGGGGNAGAVAGAVCAVLVVLIVAAVVVFFVIRRRRPDLTLPCLVKKPPPERPSILILRETGTTTEQNGAAAEVNDPIPTPGGSPGIGKPTTAPKPANLYVAAKPDLPARAVFDSIEVEHLAEYVERHRKETTGFSREFEALPKDPIKSWDVGNSDVNKKKNRYNNIRAYDSTRIVLHNPPQGSTDYINACYIGGYKDPDRRMYIGAQGPRENTLADFWHMVWQEETNIIVMLTKNVELGRSVCDYYWPCEETSSPDQMTFGEVTVKLEAEDSMSEMFIRQLRVSCQGDTRMVQQFHFTGWPDKNAPQFATSLLDFRRKVRLHMDKRTGPVVVHCSAGVGRTGTFIAIDSLLTQMSEERTINLFDFAYAMREQRVQMIQTQVQYTFVYDALMEGKLSGNTAIPASRFNTKLTELIDEMKAGTEYDNHSSELVQQYEIISVLRPVKNEASLVALETKNKDKNRDCTIVPGNNVRPFLAIKVSNSTDYINAVYVNGFKQSNAFILTQMPLENTIADLWRLLYEHRSHSILTLENDSSFPDLWPENEETPLQFGPLTIHLTCTTEEDYLITRVFKITHSSKKKAEPFKVRQFQVICWPRDADKPERPSVVCEVLDKIQHWQRQTGNKPITIQCKDGAERSGLVCTLVYVLEKLKVDHEIDVFNAVKHVRINWPHAVKSLEQYAYIHELVRLYMDQFEEYSNFR